MLALQGGDVTWECGINFVDPGVTAIDECSGDITASIILGGDTVDVATPGFYVMTYDVQDSSGNAAERETRTVTVEDITAPVITLIGGDLLLECGDSYTDPGVTATDTCDGDMTAAIIVTGDAVNTQVPDTYTVQYNVADNTGHQVAEGTRTIIVQDTTPPVLTLIGPDVISLQCNETFVDSGVTAIDNCDGNLTASITVGGDAVDTATPGTYLIVYSVTDSEGNTVQEGRAVTVLDDCSGQVVVPNVVGLHQDDAINEITSLGLTVTPIEQFSELPIGEVLSQDPAPNTTVPSGTTITLQVSKGPNITSDELRNAAQTLIENLRDENDTLLFVETQFFLANLTQIMFDALDLNGDGELTQEELIAAGAVPPTNDGNGCFANSKTETPLTNLKDFLGDLFLLGLLAWCRTTSRP